MLRIVQAQRAPPSSALEIRAYTLRVPRKPSPQKGPRPKQGARLLALRRAAGLTQPDLASLLGVAHANVAFWEWAEKPPRGDVLPKMAEAFGVTVDEILGVPPLGRQRSGPVGKLERVLLDARSLPKRDQDLVVKFVATLIEQRKAG